MNTMIKIEVVSLRRFDNGKLKAYADVLFDESFMVKGFRIAEGKNGLFVGYPQQNGKDGKWYNIFHAINKESSNRLSEAVLASYME